MKGRYRLMGDLAEIRNLTELVSRAGEASFFARAVAVSIVSADKASLRGALATAAKLAADRAAEVHRHLEAALQARDGHH